MAGVEITIDVDHPILACHGRGGDTDMERRVKHESGCCLPCKLNEDPDQVPYPGCNGNIARKDPDDAKALAIGNLCRCTVVWVEVHHR